MTSQQTRLASILIAVAGLALGCPLAGLEGRAAAQEAAAAGTPDPLPVKRITLYRSGVGYFERYGTVPGGQRVQLRFKTEQINDILKSMIVLVKPEAGRLDAVSYGSKEPIERRLASFGVNIADNPSMPQLFDRLRGAPVKVASTEGEILGTILGVEQRKTAPGKDQPAYDASYLNLVTATGLKSVAINGISSFDIQDRALAEELTKALSALAEYRADRTKTVDLTFSGGPSVPVTVAYIHEMPVWKTSYRLALPEESASDAAGKSSQVQGWAIVENTTDEDWNQVRLGLVSGRPVSFQMDLYEPLFTYRPLVAVPTIPGVAPRAYAGGMDQSLGEIVDKAGYGRFKDAGDYAKAPGAPAPSGGRAGGGGVMFDAAAIPMEMSSAGLAAYSAESRAQATEVGEVFQYELEAPVTIERQRSAMIPILNAAMLGRRVSIYSMNDGSDHPMRGVEITNSSDLQLLPGPISVYDGAAYAGDAQIGHVSPGDKRLLAYAVDLDVGVITRPENVDTLASLKIVGGLFEQTTKHRMSTTYGFENGDERRERLVVIEHPRYEGWNLTEPSAAKEQTQDLYRFELPMSPGEKKTLTVVQERTDSQQIAITSYDVPTIVAFARDGKASDAVVNAIRQLADKQSEIRHAEEAVADLDRRIAAIGEDQQRIRGNMQSIAQNSDLYSRYIKKLAEQETTLETLTTQRTGAQASLDGLKAALDQFIRGLSVE